MFVGRQRELELLHGAMRQPSSSFIPIYGRRRVGKTELILRFLAEHRGLYYVGKTAPAALQKAELCREAARTFGDPLLAELANADYKTLLLELSRRWPGPERMVLVLDEFQWLAEASPELPSVLQELWDRHWSRNKPSIALIVCGSFVGFMEREVLGKKSPLYGRRTAQIRLPPLGYREAAQFHPQWSTADKARAYFVCGGIPWYHLQLDANRSFEHNMAHALLSEFSPLFREPDFLLREELRDIETYYAVLLAIASGCATPADIARRASVQPASIAYYLQQLVDIGYISRRYPLTGARSVRRHVRYRLSDPLLSFWFRFVFPNLSFIQREGGARTWREQIRGAVEAYWGSCFEGLCRQALPAIYRAEGVTANFDVGEYWSKQVQIDLVSRRDDGWIELGECKWKSVRSLGALAAELARKIAHYPNPAGATIGQRFFLRRLPSAAPPDIPGARWHSLDELYQLD